MTWEEWSRGVEIEPSLYAADFANLGSQIGELLEAGARVFHFDMGDGRFIEPVTIGPIVIESIAPMIHDRGGVLDCHLMVERPEKHFRQVAEAGGDSVTFHVEATADLAEAVALARGLGLGVGVAFNPETSVARVLDASAGVDLVLCMSIHPGYSGQGFMPEALGRISTLRSALAPAVHVQVDGGVKRSNVAEIRAAGADLLVVGSGVFAAESPGAAYREISDAAASALASPSG
jgi:ribulose-phosphate 3-epimerase